ncbi:MAG: efflux RND transporter permease subunit [Magnetovibrio sp.]|nr:efflux RND transporter permease subunit [Magnetovibrio sp.]
MFMTPAICAWFLKVKPKAGGAANRFEGPLYVGYRGILQTILRLRVIFLGAMVVLLFGAGYALKFVDKEFFPLGDRNQYLVYFDLPAGSSIKKTDAAVRRLSSWLSDKTTNPEIASSVAYVAGGGPCFYLALSQPDPDPHRAFILVNLKSAATADDIIERTRKHVFDHFPEVQGEVKKMWMGASEPGLFQIRLIGPDAQVLLASSEQLIGTLKKLGGMLTAKQDWENPILKLTVAVDQARARSAAITSEQIANALNTYLSGSPVTDFREGNNVIPVILRGAQEERATLSGLQGLSVYSKQIDTWVPLTQMVDISGQWQPGRIKRHQQERTLTISAKHLALSAEEIHNKMKPALEALELPLGHRWEIGGEIEDQADANSNLFSTLPLCLGLIVILLVWQFNSFRRPAIIMLTIPLVLIGATLGLFVMNASFGFMVMLGFFSLAGIIINNGIVLIDRIDLERETGSSPYQAIMTACLSRLRPILITTLTTVLGLLPLIISQDPLFYGMASVIAFGLTVGTVFTLGVVPALYALFFRIQHPNAT